MPGNSPGFCTFHTIVVSWPCSTPVSSAASSRIGSATRSVTRPLDTSISPSPRELALGCAIAVTATCHSPTGASGLALRRYTPSVLSSAISTLAAAPIPGGRNGKNSRTFPSNPAKRSTLTFSSSDPRRTIGVRGCSTSIRIGACSTTATGSRSVLAIRYTALLGWPNTRSVFCWRPPSERPSSTAVTRTPASAVIGVASAAASNTASVAGALLAASGTAAWTPPGRPSITTRAGPPKSARAVLSMTAERLPRGTVTTSRSWVLERATGTETCTSGRACTASSQYTNSGPPRR